MTVPPQRDLPPGRLEARRQHLLAEITPRPSRAWPRVVALGAAAAAVAAAIAVPLSVGGSDKSRVKIVYRPVRVIVVAPRPVVQSDVSLVDSFARGSTWVERFVNGLTAEGRHVRIARHAHPAITRAEAVAAMRPNLGRPSAAWVVRLKVNGRERLVWLLAIRHGCVQSYGPGGGRFRTMWAGFVDAKTGRPMYEITVGSGRPRPC